MLGKLPKINHPDLLVGLDWHDDAGVFRMTPDLAVIQTVDYFTPIVDDPYEFGEIAAANSLSDVYAMGGEPVTAMNVVGFPSTELEYSVLGEILRGGHAVTSAAGAILVGGHSVKSPELFYGLSVLGRVHPDRVIANKGARPGDHLVLTKPIGTGVLTTALKNGKLSTEHLRRATALMKRLNRDAARLMQANGAHACTDVTGFGLVGHLYEMLAASNVGAEIGLARLPLLDGALEHALAGDKPGGLGANRRHFGPRTVVEEPKGARSPGAEELTRARLDLVFDPQTSGGLLISLEPEAAQVVVAGLAAAGQGEAAVIGRIVEGPPRIRLSLD